MARIGRYPLETLAAVGVALLLWGVLLAYAASPVWAVDFTVTKTEDTNDGSCLPTDCSLREALIAANTTPGAETITVPAGEYPLTISGANEDASATGDLDVTDTVTINGGGAGATIVSSGGEAGNTAPDLGDRVFDVANDSDATMTGLTVSGGSGVSLSGGIRNLGGTLRLTDSTVSDNTASSFIGGGGGIYNNSGTLTLTGSTVSDNSASSDGGGILNFSTLRLTDSTVSDNSASEGGGIFSNTDLSGPITTTIENSTISNNSADDTGGGIYNNDGLSTIRTTTITGNTAPQNRGAGVASVGNNARTSTVVGSSIIAANKGADPDPSTATDVDFTLDFGDINSFTSEGYNVIGDGNATSAFDQSGDQTNVADPGLGPLADNGGPTKTRAVEPNSPALDAIPSGANGCGSTFDEDQRGATRPQGGKCDIGAFELEVGLPSNRCTIKGTSGDNALRGTRGRDVICALGGEDTIDGLGGEDTIRGDEGNDRISGGAGKDHLSGGAGNDALASGTGVDELFGEAGNDKLTVRNGKPNDLADGGVGGNDRCASDRGDTKRNCEG